MKCPWKECGYVRKEAEESPDWQCPSCNNAYNKHPDYIGNDYYKIKLVFDDIPSDNEIEPGTLFLYLRNDSMEGAFISQNIVRRIIFSNKELANLSDFILKLKNSESRLNNEEERSIFLITAKLKNLYPEDKNTKPGKNFLKTLVYAFLILIFLIILYLLMSPSKSKILPITSNSHSGAKISKVSLYPDINLQDISITLDEAENLLNQCRSTCKQGCVELNQFFEKTSAQIANYRNYAQTINVDKISLKSRELIEGINNRIWKIHQEIDSINETCKEKMQESDNNTKSNELDFASVGINLDIVYSKVFYADLHIRNCRINCEINAKDSSECLKYIQLKKEYSKDISDIREFIQGKTVSESNKQVLDKIDMLIKDINLEHQKIHRCINKEDL